MSNLRNRDLRARDVNKLATYKSEWLHWDTGCDNTNEWVIASVSDREHCQKLKNWLLSKNIEETAEVVAVTLVDAALSRYKWSEILENPNRVFQGVSFKLYEINFKWHLEYAEQEVARFGRYEYRKHIK
ncbi:hypothetical protein [Vibrio mangrovi]|uniref:Uncharacterized protein n=1 Tax=Vibrio mangrovi TaxID=474394 RepID=A0A1Y6IW15_9VIBR|nr:hypothetical protein [Vibrio mangrovi]MDW6004426.1 hypothetical protein [Vibrio mangrovi]SMS00692.1 hypothetical protein VIM7927_01961 [Vibrio mangrovi]